MVSDLSHFLDLQLPYVARSDESGIEASVIGSYGVGKNIFVLPLDCFSHPCCYLLRTKMHLLDDDNVLCVRSLFDGLSGDGCKSGKSDYGAG